MSYGGYEYGDGGGGNFGGDGSMGGGGFGSPSGGGGGYMAGGAVDSPAGGGGSGGHGNKEKQSLLAVNIKQVLESEMMNQDSGARIDGVDVAQVKLVGCIVEIEDASTNTSYTIEDTTGRLHVKMFHNDDEVGGSERSAEKRARNQVGVYVRIIGNIRSWKDDRHAVAYLIEPVEDMNEITYHYLEVIHNHLFNTKGPLPGNSSVGGGAAVAQPMNGVGSPGFHGSSSQQGFTSPAANMHNSSSNQGAADAKGFTKVQQQVHDQFLGADDEQGLSVKDVISSLRGQGVSPNDVMNAVQFLSSEGHLYSTIDDDHYRSTEC